MTSDLSTPSTVKLGYYLVVYIDLLGQSRELDQIRRIPRTEEERAKATSAIASSALGAHEIRSHFTYHVTEVTKINQAILAQVPQEHRESYLRLRSLNLKQVGFSDSFAVSVRVGPTTQPEEIARSVLSIWAVLIGAASVSMLAMARGIPLRGGATIGTAVDMFENEAYGAALMDAYKLEAVIAQYNRIAVGMEVFDFLNEALTLAPSGRPGDMARSYAHKCRELICMAPDDGLPMVHMLSPSVLNLPTTSGTWAELRPKARSWVQAEVERFAEKRDYKMWGRYARLLRYLDAYPDDGGSKSSADTPRTP